jgi:hypothetical protein
MKAAGRAVRAFEAFKGERPARLRRSRLPDSDVTGWEMGPMIGVAYEARRDGKTERYFHEFKKSARPRLVASDTGRQLYIEGGRYSVTAKGIEDMPNLFVVNPSARTGRKGSSTMARRRRRRAPSAISIFARNPRRRRRSTRARSRKTIFARNPSRRRRTRAAASPARRIYRRNPRRRAAASRRRYRRNPSALGGVGKLSSLLMPAVFIGLGGVASEVACAYLPIPLAWKSGPMRYVVKAGLGVAVGLVIAKAFKQKRLGYYFAAGAVALATHDIVRAWMNANAPAVRGLGYTNPASVVRFGQYGRQLPLNQFGQYARRLPSQFGNTNSIPNARQPGGEMNFAA